MLYFIDDTFVDSADARIHVHDLGLLRGFGVYECFRCYGYEPFCLDEHLDRFYTSADHQSLFPTYNKQALQKIIYQLLEKNGVKNLVFKLFLTGGSSDDHITYDAQSRLIIICHEQKDLAAKFYERGYRVKSLCFERQSPTIKTTAYSAGIQGVYKAKQQGFDDCLYLDQEKNMLELTTSNLFFVKQNTLITPNKKILFGMTRLKTLEIAQSLDLKISQRVVPYEELFSFSEIFCTSTLKKILPICQVDEHHFKPGPITQQIMQSFNQFTQSEVLC
jgi:branched-chain amino acid aminotransferase